MISVNSHEKKKKSFVALAQFSFTSHYPGFLGSVGTLLTGLKHQITNKFMIKIFILMHLNNRRM